MSLSHDSIFSQYFKCLFSNWLSGSTRLSFEVVETEYKDLWINVCQIYQWGIWNLLSELPWKLLFQNLWYVKADALETIHAIKSPRKCGIHPQTIQIWDTLLSLDDIVSWCPSSDLTKLWSNLPSEFQLQILTDLF
jgi:hypothetical protein